MITLSDKCCICHSLNIREIKQYSFFDRVSSDCKKFQKGGNLWVCCDCSFVFSKVDEKFLKDISHIYNNYDVYYQGGGSEQIVFSNKLQSHFTRSDIICKNLYDLSILSENGISLDIGCGNGAFLKNFNKYFNKWNLYGLELDNKYEHDLNLIPNFIKLFTHDMLNLEGIYDFISLNHTLEHLLDPVTLLKSISKNIKENGFLFIQVPDSEINPYDLIIADHVSHFSKLTLANMLNVAGYEIISINNDWINKEICCLCFFKGNTSKINYKFSNLYVYESLKYLLLVKNRAKYWSDKTSLFGIFGTSISSVWLTTMYGQKIDFYVDEDLNRQGRIFFDKKILSPEEVPSNSVIFMPMIDSVLNSVRNRLINICLGSLIGPNDK